MFGVYMEAAALLYLGVATICILYSYYCSDRTFVSYVSNIFETILISGLIYLMTFWNFYVGWAISIVLVLSLIVKTCNKKPKEKI